MLIGANSQLLNASTFSANLQRAICGVVRVETAGPGDNRFSSACSAWMITDSLIVVPAYVVREGARYRCYVSGDRVSVEAEVVPRYVPSGNGATAAVLRLSRRWRDRVLTVETRRATERQTVFLLHHPEGNPKVQLSVGSLIHATGPWLRYDADTMPGSSGAPIFNEEWRVIGFHVSSHHGDHYNEGLSLAAALESLRDCPAWHDIARTHYLAPVVAAQSDVVVVAAVSPPSPDPSALLVAAVNWSVTPGALSEDVRKQVKPLSIADGNERWVLRADERRRLIKSAKSLHSLRKVPRLQPPDPRQHVIDRILGGPPYDLQTIADDDLPAWLQAIRWFEGVVPALPTVAEVDRELSRRRVRSGLRNLAGSDFQGRDDELARLHNWIEGEQHGPIVISGIGGIGKSSLIAQFAQQLEQDRKLVWLDFDRADLAPDDAISVLKVIVEQLAVTDSSNDLKIADNLASAAPSASVGEQRWHAHADAIGALLAMEHVPPLMVLDGFEVAQHVQRYEEIWAVLERLLAKANKLRILVSGRAPVEDLSLAGSPAKPFPLQGLANADAEKWLGEHGVADRSILNKIVEISQGIPLVLKLASRYLETGGQMADLPAQLSNVLIQGYLYQRILDRVIEPRLVPVARSALVLRRISLDGFVHILAPSIPADMQPKQAFELLAKELAVVERELMAGSPGTADLGSSDRVLILRPELRSATLQLLQADDADAVYAVDQRAVTWYKSQDLRDVTNAAECVYHHLRIGDIAGAEQAWNQCEGCASLLLDAVAEIPEKQSSARAWLLTKLKQQVGQPESQRAWEQSTERRVRSLLARGIDRPVAGVLAERTERSGDSLLLYDAWIRWQTGDRSGARHMLSTARAEGNVHRPDLLILEAYLAKLDYDRGLADRLLQAIDVRDVGVNNNEAPLEYLLIRAARIGLTVDLAEEANLLHVLQSASANEPSRAQRSLTPLDMALPPRGFSSESSPMLLEIAETAQSLEEMRSTVTKARFVLHSAVDSQLAQFGMWSADPQRLWPAIELKQMLETPGDRVDPESLKTLELLLFAGRRWSFLTRDLFWAAAWDQALEHDDANLSLRRSLTGLLGLIGGRRDYPLRIMYRRRPVSEIVEKHVFDDPRNIAAHPPTSDQVRLLVDILGLYSGIFGSLDPVIHEIQSAMTRTDELNPALLHRILEGGREMLGASGMIPVINYCLSPDPLEVLTRRILGLTDIA